MDTPPRVPSGRRVTRTGLEAIRAARSLPVGDKVAITDVTCPRALRGIQTVADAVIAPVTGSLRVHTVPSRMPRLCAVHPTPPPERHNKSVPTHELGRLYTAGPDFGPTRHPGAV